MYIGEMTFDMKDGRKAVLRSPVEDDAEAALAYLRTLCGETNFVLRTQKEAERFSPLWEQAFLASWAKGDEMAMLMCFVDGRLVGMADIQRRHEVKAQHRAEMSIGVLKDCWRQGLGRKMMTELIDIARKWEGVRRIELEYIDGNERAKGLYESLGFVHTGRKPEGVCQPDGTYADLCLMSMKI